MKVPCIKNFNDGEEVGLKKFVVCVHGLATHKGGSKIAALMAELEKHRVGVVALDLPGHGENKSELTIDNCVQDINTVTQNLRKFNKPISFYGSSFGGYCVMAYLLEHQQDYSEVLLVAPLIDGYKKLKSIENQEYKNIFISPEFIDSLKRHDVASNASKLGHLKIIYAEHDITVDNNEILALAKSSGAELFEIKGAGHSFGNEGELEQVINVATQVYTGQKL